MNMRLLTCLAVAAPLIAQISDAPPTAAEQQELTAKIKQTALRFRGQLPDFICTEIETRWEDTSGTGQHWKQRDTLDAQVYFAQGGRTFLKLLKRDGKPTHRDYRHIGGAIDVGLLAGAIVPTGVFSEPADPQFEWSRWEDLGGRRMAVFGFRAKPVSKNYPDGKHGFPIGFHGLVYAEPSDGMVMRIETFVDAPPGYPFEESGWDVTYGSVSISGRELVLPVKATVHARRGKNLSRNELQFTGYRKYETDSTVTFSDDH